MAKFSAELLKSLIDLRLMDKETKEKCLKEGLASLESVIKSALENLNNLLESDTERYALFSSYALAFTVTQSTAPEFSYGKPLSEDRINKYLELYIFQIAESVKWKMQGPDHELPCLVTEIDFKIIHDRIQTRFNDPLTNQSVLEEGRYKLEILLLQSTGDYLEHLKGPKEWNYLTDLHCRALYFARLNCPDVEAGKPLSKDSCSRFINEFMDALIKFTYTTSLKRRLG